MNFLPAAPHSRAASILFSDQRKGYESEMTKPKKETNQPAPADLIEKQDPDRQHISNQRQSSNSKPLLTSVPIQFMQIQNGKCRWPIGDPHHFDSLRFCGCACAPEAIYCDTHKNMAFAPNRARTFIPGRAVTLTATKVS
ncbi:GcrA family cell cycle regulator [Methylocystis sp. B8]|uniref:GcrA family cell cycle regulator n=1 Tax=Methylocystis sp. B8 TaxID=544938 RepID=UPI001484CAF5|nr:GcrA family cell cycle regulator [Methylocystis sp. B8]